MRQKMAEYGFNTSLLHGVDDKNPFGATVVPIYQTSAFRHESAEDLENIFTNKAMGFSYTRIANPTIDAFEKRITKLEGGIGSIACASGMAALTNALMNILQAMRLSQRQDFTEEPWSCLRTWRHLGLRRSM
jgi:O-acetylhomoserine (thiol)-lyase